MKTEHGVLTIPREGPALRSSKEELDNAVQELQLHKDEWATLPIADRLSLLKRITKGMCDIAPDMVSVSAQAKGLEKNPLLIGEEWMLGPYPLMRYMRTLRRALADIESSGRPRIPGPIRTRTDGQVTAQIFPQTLDELLVYHKITAEAWMQPGVTKETMLEKQAWAYSDPDPKGHVTLVLGAGNISSMGAMDILHKLFVRNQVVIFKNHPVTAHLGPFIEKGFEELIGRGFLRVVYGDVEEGAYLCHHPGVESVYMVGSAKTFESIVFGPGVEGQERKAKKQTTLEKPVSGELGNVTPFIIVPGPWKQSDIEYHAEQLASTFTANAACSCVTPRIFVQHKGWAQRKDFLDQLRKMLSIAPPQIPFYPGACERQERFTGNHPQAERFGRAAGEQLPWHLIANINPDKDDICFDTEAFCGILAETAIEADTAADYLDKAVEFCNSRLWGTLGVAIIIHPRSLKDPATAEALDRAISKLRYGIVSINMMPSFAFCLGVCPWGGFAGQEISDIQSGNTTVTNGLMLADTQKMVLRTPFKIVPKPGPFITVAGKATPFFKRLSEMDAAPSIWKLPGILLAALKNP